MSIIFIYSGENLLIAPYLMVDLHFYKRYIKLYSKFVILYFILYGYGSLSASKR